MIITEILRRLNQLDSRKEMINHLNAEIEHLVPALQADGLKLNDKKELLSGQTFASNLRKEVILLDKLHFIKYILIDRPYSRLSNIDASFQYSPGTEEEYKEINKAILTMLRQKEI